MVKRVARTVKWPLLVVVAVVGLAVTADLVHPVIQLLMGTPWFVYGYWAGRTKMPARYGYAIWWPPLMWAAVAELDQPAVLSDL